jgi:competence protein ComFC
MIGLLKRHIFEPLIDLFFPPLCVLCNKNLEDQQKIVCKPCLSKIPKYNSINRYSFLIKKFDTLYILYEYDERVQLLIHLFKYNSFLTLSKYFAQESLNTYPDIIRNDYTSLIPVPLHKAKLRERGYNQSEIFAKHLAGKLNTPVNDQYLIRKRYTLSQTHLNREEREKNVADAFYCAKKLSGEKILLIDDVITTGSTVNACTEALKRAGADIVDVFVLANPVMRADDTHESVIKDIEQ